MIPLPTTFRSDGFDFKQLAREGGIALFCKTKLYKRSEREIKLYGKEPTFEFESYEVVIVRKEPAHTWPNGIITPEHERMPGNEDWGLYGWSLQTKDRAWEKFRELIAKELAA